MRISALHAAALAFSTATLLSSGQLPSAESTLVRRVLIPVRVQLAGEPVRGIEASRFTLEVDGTEVAIDGLEEVDLGEESQAGRTADLQPFTSTHRSVVMLFDWEMTESALIEKARNAAREAVLSLAQEDLLAVADYSSATGLRLLMPFSTDRRQAIRALSALGDDQVVSPPEDPLGLVLGDSPAQRDVQPSHRKAPPKSSAQVRGANHIVRPDQEVERANKFLVSVSELAQRLRPLPGIKSILIFSRGVPDELVEGRAEDPSLQSYRTSRIARSDAREQFGYGGLRTQLSETARALQSADCVAFTIDLGSSDARSATGNEFLRRIATSTGGQPFNRVQLGDALSAFAEVTAHYYVVSFDPGQLSGFRQGRVRQLELSVQGLPKRTLISSRSEFVDEVVTAYDPLVQAHWAVAGAPTGPIALALRVLPAIGEPNTNERMTVPFVLEIDGPTLLSQSGSGSTVGLEILGYATRRGGEISDHFAQRLDLDRRAVGERLGTSGILFLRTFSLPTGQQCSGITRSSSNCGSHWQ